MKWSHLNLLPTWRSDTTSWCYVHLVPVCVVLSMGLGLSCFSCNADPHGPAKERDFSSRRLYLEISKDKRSVIVATPAGSVTIFNVIDACVEGGEPPVVNGFYLGGEHPLAVKYSGSCVASLNLEEKNVTCVACD